MTVSPRGLSARSAEADSLSGLPANATPLPVLKIGMTADDVPTTHGTPDHGGARLRAPSYPTCISAENRGFTHVDTPTDIPPGLFIIHDLHPRARVKTVTGFRPVQNRYHDFTQISIV